MLEANAHTHTHTHTHTHRHIEQEEKVYCICSADYMHPLQWMHAATLYIYKLNMEPSLCDVAK